MVLLMQQKYPDLDKFQNSLIYMHYLFQYCLKTKQVLMLLDKNGLSKKLNTIIV